MGDDFSSAAEPGSAMVTVSMWLEEAREKRGERAQSLGRALKATKFAPKYLLDLLTGNKAAFDGVADSGGGAIYEPPPLVEDWNKRHRRDVIDAVFGFTSVCLQVQPVELQAELVESLMLRDPVARDVLFGGGDPRDGLFAPPSAAGETAPEKVILRPRLVRLLQLRHNLADAYVPWALEKTPPVLFTCADHFSSPVVAVLRTLGKEFNDTLFTKVAVAGIRLGDVRGLAPADVNENEPWLEDDCRLWSVERQCLSPQCRVQLDAIASVILARPEKDFLPFDGKRLLLEGGEESVVSCVIDATNCLDMLDGALQTQFRKMIKNSAWTRTRALHFWLLIHASRPPFTPDLSALMTIRPTAWPAAIKGMATLAIFLKYTSKERLDLAYEQFFECNRGTDSEGAIGGAAAAGGAPHNKILDYIARARGIFAESLVDPRQFTAEFSGQMYETLMDDLRSADGVLDPDLKLLSKITAEWMKKKLGNKGADGNYEGVAIAPRHVQSITFFVVAQWLRDATAGRRRGGSGKGLMGTMGTGEGKSLVFAMLACFAVKSLKMRVHVLESSQSLKHRDCEENRAFFDNMGVTVGESSEGAFPDVDVVYCLAHPLNPHLLQHYIRTILTNEKEFANTLLLVDEVDSVVVCESPFETLPKALSDGPSAGDISRAYEAVHRGDTTRPNSISAAAWEKALTDKIDWERERGKCDRENGTGAWFLRDMTGAPDGYYHGYIDYINVVSGFQAVPAAISAPALVTSLPYILTRYAAVVGLSGSLGGAAERNYLKKSVSRAWRDRFVSRARAEHFSPPSPGSLSECTYFISLIKALQCGLHRDPEFPQHVRGHGKVSADARRRRRARDGQRARATGEGDGHCAQIPGRRACRHHRRREQSTASGPRPQADRAEPRVFESCHRHLWRRRAHQGKGDERDERS